MNKSIGRQTDIRTNSRKKGRKEEGDRDKNRGRRMNDKNSKRRMEQTISNGRKEGGREDKEKQGEVEMV